MAGVREHLCAHLVLLHLSLHTPVVYGRAAACTGVSISSQGSVGTTTPTATTTLPNTGSCNTAACSGCTSCSAAQTCANTYYCSSNQYVTNFQCSIYNGVGSWTATCIHAVCTHHINCNPHQARCWSRRRGHRRHVHLNPQESRENRPTVREADAHCVMHCTLFLVCPKSFGHDAKRENSCLRAQPVAPTNLVSARGKCRSFFHRVENSPTAVSPSQNGSWLKDEKWGSATSDPPAARSAAEEILPCPPAPADWPG